MKTSPLKSMYLLHGNAPKMEGDELQAKFLKAKNPWAEFPSNDESVIYLNRSMGPG